MMYEMVDRSQYKVGVITSITACTTGNASSKKLRSCQVKVSEHDDDENAIITVVTAATNVREGSRIVVAPIGSTVVDETGEDLLIQKTSVGGVMSEGMLCDARILGWVGGAEGIAAQIPDSYPLGSAPPDSKPRTDNNTNTYASSELPAVEVKPLFEKKLTKEEKKKIADEKRKAKKAAKEATVDTNDAEIDDE